MSWRLYQAKTEPTVAAPEAVTESRWHQPLSDPTRRRGINVALVPFEDYTSHWNLLTPEIVWLEQMAEPVRQKPGLPAYLQHYFEFQPAPMSVIGLRLMPWYLPLTEPVRQKPGLGATQQQALAWNPNVTFLEQSYYSKYSYQWTEPVRQKPGLGAHLQHFFEFQPAPTSSLISGKIPWYNWLSNPPVLTKLRLNTGSQPVSTISPYIPSIQDRSHGYVIE